MILSGSLFFWLLQCTLFLLGNADDAHHIRGVPGKDYPNYETIPQTSFRCSEQLHIPGLYADPETGCQMFHHCYEHRHESFLCPPGTIFNQAILACDYWYSAECSTATLHFGDYSPHKAINLDLETEFIPKKNPSLNVFDKMASLYEVKEPVPSSPKTYRSNIYNLEESNHFSEEHVLGMHTNIIENQNFPSSYLAVSNLHDRREGIISESFDEYSSEKNENYKKDLGIDYFTDFESSGDLDEHLFTADDLLSLNDTEKDVDFEKYFLAYNNGNHSENYTEHRNPVYNNEELIIDTDIDLTDKQKISSKEDLEFRDIFVRRQSENIANRIDKLKNKRRKPIFTIKSEAEMEPLTTTEKLKDETNGVVDYPISTLKESTTGFKSLSTSAPSKTKRRKPIFIDLEDLPQYNVNNGQNVPGDTRTTSISYEVNHQSKIPNFSIAAEEISVKLFPGKVERRPVNEYLVDPTEKYNIGPDRNTELKSLSNLASLPSSIYDTSTLSTLKDVDMFKDVSMDIGQVYPKRKKNIIHIIDSGDDHIVYVENKGPTDATVYSTEFEDEITTQPLNENYDFSDKFFEANVNYYDGEKEHDSESDSVEVDTDQYEDSYQFVSPYSHNEVSDGKDGTYFTEINPEVAFDTKKYEAESGLEVEANYVNPKSMQDFDINKHENMHDSPYVTTEFSISEISTHMSHETQYDETSQIYFLPDTDVQFTFDNLGTTENIPNLIPETLDKNHNVRKTLMNNFESNPSYQTTVESIGYKLLDNSKNEGNVTEYFHSENEDLQNLSKQLPPYTFQSNKEINLSQNSEFEENKLNYESKIVDGNISQSNSHAESAISKNEIEEFDPVSYAELQEYLSNENTNIDNNLSFDVTKDTYMKPSIPLMEDSSKYSSERQYHSYDPIFDEDTLKDPDSIQNEEENIYQTVPSNLESNHNVHLSDDPIEMNTFKMIKQESVKSKGGEVTKASDFQASSNDFDDSQADSLDELKSEHTTASEFGLFETQNIPSYLIKNFNRKPNFNIKNTVKGSPKNAKDKFILSTETTFLNKGFANLKQNIPENMKTGLKQEPVKKTRAFISPHQMNSDLETFDYQNFAILPNSMMKLKQSSINEVLPDSIYRAGMTYSTRTGNLLDSPKVSKLISIGKNLLRAKKAKLRILGRYVNYF